MPGPPDPVWHQENMKTKRGSGRVPAPKDNPFKDPIPPDPLMAGAWYSALNAALMDDEAHAAFRTESGMSYSAPKSPIEVMIDAATGADLAYLVAFVRWFNDTTWGDIRLDHTGCIDGVPQPDTQDYPGVANA